MSDRQPVPLSPSSYSLEDFVVNFELPQPVTVQDGYFDEYQSGTIGAGAVCNLLSIESVETGIFEDEDGEDMHIPLNDPIEVERVAEARFQQHLTLKDLIHESSTVKFVRVLKTDPNFESIIRRGDKLKIKRKKSRATFLAFKKVSDKGKPLMKVPASCRAKFLPLLDGEELPLNKFVKKYKLPTFVVMNFIDYSTDKNSNKEEEIPREKPTTRIVKSRRQLSNTRVLRLKGILADFIVLASMEVDGVPLKFSFPKTIPMNVVPLSTESSSGPPDSKLEFVSSERNETRNDSSELITVEENDYEDMSGFRDPQRLSQSKMSVGFENNSKCGDETKKITQLAGLAAHNNTYSPAPSKKVGRSQSVNIRRQGNWRFSRSVGDLGLSSEDNIYDELQFHTLPQKMKKHPTLLRRRGSDWSIERVSKQNLTNLLHLQAQKSEDHGFRSHVEVVSLQIPRLSPTYKKCPMMKTFGRKGKINETENSPIGVQGLNLDSYSSQSLDGNRLPTKLTSMTSKAPFYEFAEMEEDDAAVNPNLSNQSERRRESGDALPSLPSSQRSCGDRFQLSSRDLLLKEKVDPKGRHNVIDTKIPLVGTCLKKTIPPEPPEEDDLYENVKLQTKSIVSPTSVREAVTNKSEVSVGVSSVGTTKNERKTGPQVRRDQCSIRERQLKSAVNPTGLQEPENIEEEEEPPPIPARLKHSEEPLYSLVAAKRNPSQDKISENTAYSSHLHSNPLPTGRPQPSPRRPQDGSNLSPSDLIRTKSIASVHSDSVPPSLEMKPVTAVRNDPNSNFAIPKDLSVLSVTDVVKCLNALNMKKFEETFSERQVDGNMLVCLDEEALESIGMDRFHRLKLLKFIAGWRPQLH